MKNETTLPQGKLRLLGNILLVVACLGLIGSAVLFSFTITDSPPSEHPEIEEMMDEIMLPEGISLDTTVRELLAEDRAFFNANLGIYRALSFLAAAFMMLIAFVFLRLALAWRKAEPFGRPTVVGLRCLGVLLVVQFFVGWVADVIVPRAAHSELLFHGDLYEWPVEFLAGGGPCLSSGILFLILSWVLEYGRKIKEEQALTI